MKLWNELMAVALVGTGKVTQLPADIPDNALGRFLSQIEGNVLEETLLKRCGSVAIWRRNGPLPVRLTVGEESPAGTETLALIGASSAWHLATMLSGTHPAVLPEWLETAKEFGKRVSPEWLPALLEAVRKNRRLQIDAEPVMGERGRWLALKNPEWTFSAPVQDFLLWETGLTSQRVELLRQIHRGDPVKARTMLGEVWEKEAAELRKEFLKAIEESVEPGDEAFLEKALDDKSKEVRRVAVEALLHLPSSDLLRRMEARAEKLFEFKPPRLLAKAKVDFDVPENIDEEMLRDGIDTKPHIQSKKLGEKAAALMLIVAATPPELWREKTGLHWEVMVPAVLQSEWALAILSGWASAAERFGDLELTRELLGLNQAYDVLIGFERLIRVLPEKERAAWVVQMMRKKFLTLEAGKDPRLTIALDSFVASWPENLTEPVMSQLRSRMESESTDWALSQAMQRYALHVPIGSIAAAAQNWKPSERNASAVEKFQEILRFRHEMRLALKTP